MNVLRMLKSQWLTLSSYGYGHSQSFFNFLFVLCYMLQIIKCMSVVEQKQTNKKFETHGHLPPLFPAPAPPCLGSGSSVRTLSRLPPPLPEIHVPSSRTVRCLLEGAHGRGGGPSPRPVLLDAPALTSLGLVLRPPSPGAPPAPSFPNGDNHPLPEGGSGLLSCPQMWSFPVLTSPAVSYFRSVNRCFFSTRAGVTVPLASAGSTLIPTPPMSTLPMK